MAAIALTPELLTPQGLLGWAMDSFGDKLAFTTGLGPGGIALLHMARQKWADVSCAFLDTSFHFPETLDYLEDIQDLLDVEILAIRPKPFGPTWREDRLACCDHRKVAPLAQALAGKQAWVNARRGDQGGARSGIAAIERDAVGFVKINPLAYVDRAWVDAYLAQHGVPKHPLLSQGFGSVGCEPCTRKLRPGESERDGRLFAKGHTECGIHTRLLVKE